MTHASLARVDLGRVTPSDHVAMQNLAETAEENALASGLEPVLLELVRIRSSQINGCAFCLDLHTRQALSHGETEERLNELATWTESWLFTTRERAALGLAEAVTLVHDGHVSDDVYRAASDRFEDDQLAGLLWTITVVNAYNRLAVSTRLGQ